MDRHSLSKVMGTLAINERSLGMRSEQDQEHLVCCSSVYYWLDIAAMELSDMGVHLGFDSQIEN